MATYTLTTDDSANFIVIKNNQGIPEQRQIISFNDLYNGKANRVVSKDNLIRSQQKVNYLDCIKDGKAAMGIPACQALFQGLELFPKAGESGYPAFSELAEMEKNLTKLQKDRMDIKQVAKLKNKDDFLPELDYDEAMWESGLSVERVCNKDVIKIKTFGSFIDPLEKEGYDDKPPPTDWPKPGDKIVIDAKAMEAMGFGQSTLEATRKKKEPEENPYNFTLEIKCGKGMQSAIADKNTITQETENYKNYFAGNAEKGKLLKSGTLTEEKIKTIILKEWGDKMQVVIYFMKYYFNPNKITLCAADKVVFMFCLMLNLPCVYTGYLDDEDRLPELIGKKIYSTVEYNPPKSPEEIAKQKYDRTSEGILKNNNKLIEFMEMQLDDGKKKDIYIKGYEGPQYIHPTFYHELIKFVKNMNKAVVESKSNFNKNEIIFIEQEITRLKKENMVIVFFKLQGKKKKKIFLLATQTKLTVTAKVNSLDGKSNNLYNFIEAKNKENVNGGAKNMKGGDPPDDEAADTDMPSPAELRVLEEAEEYEEMLGELPILNIDGSVDKDTYPNDPSAKYIITKDVEIDLQEELIKGVYRYYHDDEDEGKADIVYNYMLYDGILSNGNLMPGLNIEGRIINTLDKEKEFDVKMTDDAAAEAMELEEEEEEEEEEAEKIKQLDQIKQQEDIDFKRYLDQLEKEVIGGEDYYRFTAKVKKIKKSNLEAEAPPGGEPSKRGAKIKTFTAAEQASREKALSDNRTKARKQAQNRIRKSPPGGESHGMELEGGKKRKRKTRKAKKKKKRKTRRKRKTNTKKKKKKTRRKIKKRNRKTKRKGIKKKIEKKKR